MAISKIDKTPALIVIDLQKGIVQFPATHPTKDVIANAGALATAFRTRGFPVILVNVTGGAPGRTEVVRPKTERSSDWSELVSELDKQPTDILITKERWGAFIGTTLHERLQELGVTQVIVAGISTSIGVESTARSAYEYGYNVVLAVDAMTDTNADAHENSITRIFPRLGETATTDEIIRALEM